MDSLIVASKLEALRRCVKRIEERRTRSAEELRASADLEDFRQFAAAVARCLGGDSTPR